MSTSCEEDAFTYEVAAEWQRDGGSERTFDVSLSLCRFGLVPISTSSLQRGAGDGRTEALTERISLSEERTGAHERRTKLPSLRRLLSWRPCEPARVGSGDERVELLQEAIACDVSAGFPKCIGGGDIDAVVRRACASLISIADLICSDLARVGRSKRSLIFFFHSLRARTKTF